METEGGMDTAQSKDQRNISNWGHQKDVGLQCQREMLNGTILHTAHLTMSNTKMSLAEIDSTWKSTTEFGSDLYHIAGDSAQSRSGALTFTSHVSLFS